ncbi:uncharacterized protein NPIL_273981 [Nephila pilipes]|uniref:C2H2-type domain-containing protein n=1 Tax=Nephila pilipes TaxID=299642 RepID=A0A8X6MFP0_NEPPI|nr:uncharacterized protein NPIL_273981 [Nephila pilipes]
MLTVEDIFENSDFSFNTQIHTSDFGDLTSSQIDSPFEDEDDKKSYDCLTCYKSFKYSKNLKRHEKKLLNNRGNKRQKLNSSAQLGPSGYRAPAVEENRNNTRSCASLNAFHTYRILTDSNFINNLNGFLQNSKEEVARIIENKSKEKKGPDGMMVKPPTVFRRKNAIDEFFGKLLDLLDEEKLILDTLHYVKPMVFSPTDEENYKSLTQCSICEKPFNGDAAMSQNLPTYDFSWTDEYVNFMDVPDDSDIGYIFEVDLEYPNELHYMHSCYPLAPEKIEVSVSECSPYTKNIAKELNILKLKSIEN